MLVAVLAAVALTRAAHQWTPTTVPVRTVTAGHRISAWIALALLLVFSWAAPVALLIANLTTSQPFQQFFTLHVDDLAWSLLVAGVAALIAYLTALGAVSCCAAAGLARRVSSIAIPGTIFLAMFLPASLLAVSLLKLSSISGIGVSLRQSWVLVSMGQASRFAG